MGAQKSKLSPAKLRDLTNQTLWSVDEIKILYMSCFPRSSYKKVLSRKQFLEIYEEFFPESEAETFTK